MMRSRYFFTGIGMNFLGHSPHCKRTLRSLIFNLWKKKCRTKQKITKVFSTRALHAYFCLKTNVLCKQKRMCYQKGQFLFAKKQQNQQTNTIKQKSINNNDFRCTAHGLTLPYTAYTHILFKKQTLLQNKIKNENILNETNKQKYQRFSLHGLIFDIHCLTLPIWSKTSVLAKKKEKEIDNKKQ